MRHPILLICLLITMQQLSAQTISRQVLSTMGGSYQGANFQATYTVGETIISTMGSGNLTANQGFQQPACQTTTSSFTASSIGSYTWNTSTYTTSGAYTQTFTNFAGCDSIVTLNLTVYRTSVTMTLQNVVQTSPNIFQYDVILTNTGNTTLGLQGYTCGINHATGMRNGGTLTHTFLSRDPILSALPNVTAAYTSSTNHLRLLTANVTAGNEFNMAPGASIRLATMRVSNSVPFPADFVPALNLQTLIAIGKTPCVATCIATPPGSSYAINGTANTPSTGTLQALTGVVNTPCLYLNPSSAFAVTATQTTLSSCSSNPNISAQVSVSGIGSTSLPGTYALDGGPATNYSTSTFSLSSLTVGSHSITVTSGAGCTTSNMFTISQPSFTNSIIQSDTTICQGASITLNAVTGSSGSSALPGNLQNGLIAWYPFNGNANDESGNGHNGIVTGATLTNDRNGNASSAYYLTYSGWNPGSQLNEIYIPYSPSLNTTNISVSSWINTGTMGWPGSGMVILNRFQYGFSNPNGQAWSIWLDNNINHLKAAVLDGAVINNQNMLTVGGSTISQNSWHHVVFTFDGNSLKLFDNGNLVGVTNSPGFSLNTTGTSGISMGISDQANGFWWPYDGIIDDAGIWDRALTNQEIQQLYSSTNAYTWSNGSFSPSITITPSQTTTYYLTKIDSSGTCSDSITVTVSNPSISAGTNQSICLGDSVTLTASGATSYSWSNSVINGVPFTPTSTQTYTVTGTNSFGCTATSQVAVTVNPRPNAYVAATGATTFCNGNSVVLNANGGNGLTYQWYNTGNPIAGATSSSYQVNQSGNYWVQETNQYACSSVSNTQQVVVNNCDVSLDLKLFYQGYYAGMSTMAPTLMNEGVGSDPAVTDTILIDLHSPLPPYGLVRTKKAILHTDGHALCTFEHYANNYYLADSYYVAIRHRNVLTTWSSNPLLFTSTAVSYDFSTASSQAYGDNMTEVEPGIWALFAGELNYDENIDLLDNSIMENDIANFSFGYYSTDLNGDGNSDLLDVPILEMNIYNFIYSSQPAWSGTLPSVSTNPVTSVTAGTAISGGTILSDGGVPITEKGVCWSLNPNPTVADSKTTDGGGNGNYTSSVADLQPLSTYYLRAFASSSVGTVYGNEVMFTSGQLAIGQNYQGGKVAYILQLGDPGYDSNELRGIVAAPSDQSNGIYWSTGGLFVTGATGTELGAGMTNTNKIVSSLFISGDYAAKLCYDLTLNGFADWYLPSKDELNKVYENRNAIGITPCSFYWSSTEATSGAAWWQYFCNGNQSVDLKSSNCKVRAIRSFTAPNNFGISTVSISSITHTSAISGGYIATGNSSSIISRGVCWSISPHPTVALNSKTIDGNGPGSYISNMTGLNPGTMYYVRAYATSNTGTVYGNELTFTTTLGIGSNFGGGIVAYLFHPGDQGYIQGETHGIIAAQIDQGTAQWGCLGTTISGADGNAIGTGNQNTMDIINGCSELNIAARICSDLVLNGYSDWYLPSWDELTLLYTNRLAIGGFTNSGYWSSTENSANAARFLDFDSGGIGFANKSNSFKARAIRNF